VELLLLPIFQRGTTDGRLIGVLAPAAAPYWLGVKPVQSFTLNSWRHVSPQLDAITVPKYFDLPEVPATPAAAATAPAARQRAFVVFNGGRA